MPTLRETAAGSVLVVYACAALYSWYSDRDDGRKCARKASTCAPAPDPRPDRGTGLIRSYTKMCEDRSMEMLLTSVQEQGG